MTVPTVPGATRSGYDDHVSPLDTLALIGEILSWVGLGAGIPLLIVAEILRAVRARWIPTEITVVRIGTAFSARWAAGGDHWERPVRDDESDVDEGVYPGETRRGRPDVARFASPGTVQKTCVITGGVLTGAGVIGFVASWIPALV